ncbi:MAG: UDP-N-acetylglucosamine 2-epimerase [Pseudobutyrivibrio sp.]|nr:UDP-N-acetylglucosamine 2-epimerase [Pseudobutyrivibrio sp.]
MAKNLYFYIGTEAEFIKVFPVITEAQAMGAICHIIASGQNDLTKSRILDFIELNGKFVELSKESDIKKTAMGLLGWYRDTRKKALGIIREEFDAKDMNGAPFIVHGDTVSTLMGAYIGSKLGCVVCHVEAGLRSHNLLNPFPEEIDRMLTSRKARMHFAPGDEPAANLGKVRGEVINTQYNTILDSLRTSRRMPVLTPEVEALTASDSSPYFVFVMHRQENLANSDFFTETLDRVKDNASRIHCVLILHKITEVKLEELGLLTELQEDDRFTLLPRVDYFDFMKLLNGAKYVITDGGSNQEELHYMGKPTLIMRKTTERNEGLGSNAMLFGSDLERIPFFAKYYESYEIEPVDEMYSPSKMIAERLIGHE